MVMGTLYVTLLWILQGGDTSEAGRCVAEWRSGRCVAECYVQRQSPLYVMQLCGMRLVTLRAWWPTPVCHLSHTVHAPIWHAPICQTPVVPVCRRMLFVFCSLPAIHALADHMLVAMCHPAVNDDRDHHRVGLRGFILKVQV